LSSAEEEIVKSSAAILECLGEVSRNNSPLFLSANDEKDSKIYESRIQSIAPQENQIILHQVLPGDWREAINPSLKLEIRSCMQLGNIRFTGFLSPLDDSDNNPYCHLSLPNTIYRKQLRDHFRVSLATTDTTASLHLDEETSFIGKCKDISMGGALVHFPLENANLCVGQTIEHCSVAIEDLLKFEFRGKICSLKRTEREILAGIQFLDITPQHKRPISLVLNKIERQNINA